MWDNVRPVKIRKHIPAAGAALLSAALLTAAYPPFGETAAIAAAIAPLLVVARLVSPRKAAWTWFGGGFAFWFTTLGWMPAICKNDGPWPLVGLGWFGLAALCAGYFALFGWLAYKAADPTVIEKYSRQLSIIIVALVAVGAAVLVVRWLVKRKKK